MSAGSGKEGDGGGGTGTGKGESGSGDAGKGERVSGKTSGVAAAASMLVTDMSPILSAKSWQKSC